MTEIVLPFYNVLIHKIYGVLNLQTIKLAHRAPYLVRDMSLTFHDRLQKCVCPRITTDDSKDLVMLSLQTRKPF